MVSQFAALAGVPVTAVRLTVSAASLLFLFEITSFNQADVFRGQSAVASALRTPESANAALSGTGAPAIIAAPQVEEVDIVLVQAPALPPASPSLPPSPSPPPPSSPPPPTRPPSTPPTSSATSPALPSPSSPPVASPVPPSPGAPPLNSTADTGIVSRQTATELGAGGITGIALSVLFLLCCFGVCVVVYCMRRAKKAPPGIEKLTATTVEVDVADVVQQKSFAPLPPSLEELTKMDEEIERQSKI